MGRSLIAWVWGNSPRGEGGLELKVHPLPNWAHLSRRLIPSWEMRGEEGVRSQGPRNVGTFGLTLIKRPENCPTRLFISLYRAICMPETLILFSCKKKRKQKCFQIECRSKVTMAKLSQAVNILHSLRC